jgi:hypothetical protein
VVTPTVPGREYLLAECSASVIAAGLVHLVGVDGARDGPAVVRNKLVEVVQSDWVVFLDDDDLLDPDYEKIVAPHFEHADFVYTGWDLDGAEDPQPMGLDPFLQSWRNTIPVTACVRTEVFRAVGGFRVDRPQEDHELWKDILFRHPLAWDPERRRPRWRVRYEPTVAWKYRRGTPGNRSDELAKASGE